MNATAFPALFKAADSASRKAQTTYLRLFRVALLLLICGAILASVSASSATWHQISAVIGAALIGISLIVSTALKILAPEKVWFGARAVAESVKSISWRYIVGGSPIALTCSRKLPMHGLPTNYVLFSKSDAALRGNMQWSRPTPLRSRRRCLPTDSGAHRIGSRYMSTAGFMTSVAGTQGRQIKAGRYTRNGFGSRPSARRLRSCPPSS